MDRGFCSQNTLPVPGVPSVGSGLASLPEEQETQGEAIARAWIDPVILTMVAQLLPSSVLPGHINGLKFFVRLCAEATQPELFLNSEIRHIAKIYARHGVSGLCQLNGWEWGRETTLKVLQVLEALTVLTRRRQKGVTVIEIPLGKREFIPNEQELITKLNTLEKKRSNKKTRQLIARVKARLQHFTVPGSANITTCFHYNASAQQFSLNTLKCKLLTRLQAEHLSPDLCEKIASMLVEETTPFIEQLCLGRQETDGRDPQAILQKEGRASPVADEKEICLYSSAAFHKADFVTEKLSAFQHEYPSYGAVCCQTKNRLPNTIEKNHSVENPEKSPLASDKSSVLASEAHNEDDFFCHSNLEYILHHKINIKFDYENEEALQAEALRFITVLGEQLPKDVHRAKGVINGFKNCIKRDPLRAHVSLINTLLRKYCPLPDQGPLKKNPGGWFHNSYKRYGDVENPLSLDDDIKRWAEASYSYEKIARGLRDWAHHPLRKHWTARPTIEDIIDLGLLPPHTDETDEREKPLYPSLEEPWEEDTCIALFEYYAGRFLSTEELEKFWPDAEMLVEQFARFQVEESIRYHLANLPSSCKCSQTNNAHLLAMPNDLLTFVEWTWPNALHQLLTTGTYRGMEIGEAVTMEDGTILSREDYFDLCKRASEAVFYEKHGGRLLPAVLSVDSHLFLRHSVKEKEENRGDIPALNEVDKRLGDQDRLHVQIVGEEEAWQLPPITAQLQARALQAAGAMLGYTVKIVMHPLTFCCCIVVTSKHDTTDTCVCTTELHVRTLLDVFRQEALEIAQEPDEATKKQGSPLPPVPETDSTLETYKGEASGISSIRK